MTTLTPRQLTAFRKLADIIEETVGEASDPALHGTPSGPIYAAMMSLVSLEIYQTLLRVLVAEGRIVQDGDILRVGPRSRFAA